MERGRRPAGLVWLTSVAIAWVLATAALAGLMWPTLPGAGPAALIETAMRSAAAASVLIGGPATAVALRVRRTGGLSRAVLCDLAVVALITGCLCGYLAEAGLPLAGAWLAFGPVLAVAMAEMGVAFVLRGRSPVRPGGAGRA